jgi:uncharacterized protein involved in type VI secretion and phage assembly
MLNSLNDRIEQASKDATDHGYIIGVVEDNDDPEGLGRIKVSIPNLFEPGQGDLPWIGPAKKSPFGIGSAWGVYGSPAVGSEVAIKFQDGNAHYGISEFDLYSKANANPKFKDPKTWGFKDPAGNELFVNYDTGAWEFTHQSGLTIKYDVDGNRTTHVPGDSTSTIDGDETQTVSGDEKTTIDGDETRTISGSLTIGVTGDITINGASVNVTGSSDVNITGSGSVNIHGGTINLN